MINQVIESIRAKLYEITDSSALTAENTIKLSQELNQFLNFQSRKKIDTRSIDYANSSVHANAILNIFEVSQQEKLDIADLIKDSITNNHTWYKIDFIRSLLDSISSKYGSDVVEYMGQFVPERCLFPESIDTFQNSILRLDDIYRLNHQSSSYIGEYLPYLTMNTVQLFCHTPHYPASFNHGILQGLAKKFNESLKVTLVNKDHGGEFKIVI